MTNSISRLCPMCGEPSRAKVACHTCRGKGLVTAGRVCCDCSRPMGKSRGKRCTMCVQRSNPVEQCSGCGELKRLASKSDRLCGACSSRLRRARLGYDKAYKTLHKVCAFCRVPFETKKHSTSCCSVECGQRLAYGWSSSKEVARVIKPRVWHGSASAGVVPFTSGACHECGEQFVAPSLAKYCSDRCSNRASWRRAYARKGDFSVPRKVRLAIYERDGWVCQLCFGAVDPDLDLNDRWSATLDHIVPQSHQLIPDHSPENLRLSHRVCNSIRGDGSREVAYGEGVEALRYVGRVSAASS